MGLIVIYIRLQINNLLPHTVFICLFIDNYTPKSLGSEQLFSNYTNKEDTNI